MAFEKKIADLKRLVRNFSARNNNLSAMLNAAPHMIGRITPDGQFRYVNMVWEKTLGFSKQQLAEMNIFRELVHPDDHLDVMKRISSKPDENGNTVFKCRIRCRNGSHRPFEWMCYQSHNNEIIAVVKDLSLNTVLIDQIEKGKKNWERTFDAIQDWICLLDNNNRIVRSNRALRIISDLDIQSVIGMSCCELIHQRKTPVAGCPVLKMRETLTRETLETEITRLGKWLEISADPILDDRNELICSVLIVRDITRHKQLENKLVQNRKARSFSVLAGGIAHDYNNLMTVIMGNVSMAYEISPANTDIHQFLSEAQDACYEVRDLTHRFMDLTGNTNPPRMTDTIDTVIGFTLNEETRNTDIFIDFKTDSRLFPVKFNPAGIMQLVRYLTANAVEAMKNGGKLSVSLENFEISKDNATRYLFPEGAYVLLTFKDTGDGIPPENMDKIFDPYFSTKERGKERAMGLSLAAAYAIVKKHNGFIKTASAVGKGTVIEIAIPSYKPPESLPDRYSVVSENGSGCILVLEDDAVLRRLYEVMIEKTGYSAVTVKTGEEAVLAYQKFKTGNRNFDLLIFDQAIKGGLNGVDALKEIRKTNPDIRAVVVTGSPSYPVISEFKKYGFSDRLLKPFSFLDLQNIIRHFAA